MTPTRSNSGHSFGEHTGEVLLRLNAPTLSGLFVQAGIALSRLLLGPRSRAAEGEAEAVTLDARDREALLVAWLNELVYRGETRKRVYTEFHIEHVDERTLRARIRGIEPPRIRTEVKAATMHRLHIERNERGYRASVVLDV